MEIAYGDQEMHAVLRSKCMNHLRKNGDDFKKFLLQENIHGHINCEYKKIEPIKNLFGIHN